MRIVSVNVSEVRAVDDDGKSVRTGIFKRPVEGKVGVGTLNLDGDDQADRKNHGGEHKAVYAFGQQHLPHWREALGHEDIGPGFFGENLSVDTLDESTLRVGDRLRIGTALLEITQPRVPCFKLGLRAGVRTLPRQFLRHGHTGAYLRVLEKGELAAGAEVTIDSRGEMAYTLAELFAAAQDLRGGAPRREVLESALSTFALSGEWRTLVEGRLRRLGAS